MSPGPAAATGLGGQDRPRVAMVGFQGFGNVGDEAILCGIETLIGARLDVATIFAGGRGGVVAFSSARRVRTWRHLPTPGAWRILRRSTGLLISGGGLVNDHWATVIPRYLAWVLTARLLGCRVVWVGAGVGPIRRRGSRFLAGLGFGSSRLVTVRDTGSRDWVRRCAPRVPVTVVPDPAFFLPRPDPGSGGRGLGIVARGPVRSDQATGRRLAGALADVAVRRSDDGVAVTLLSFHHDEDRAFLALLEAAFAARGRPLPPVTPADPDPAVTLRTIVGFDQLLTVRLHGLILGALVALPAVSVGYDAKVDEVARQLGLDDLLVPLGAVSGTTLLDALDRSIARPDRRDDVRDRVAALRARQGEVADLLVGAVAS